MGGGLLSIQKMGSAAGVLDGGLCGYVSIESAQQDHHLSYYYNVEARHKTIGIFPFKAVTLWWPFLFSPNSHRLLETR